MKDMSKNQGLCLFLRFDDHPALPLPFLWQKSQKWVNCMVASSILFAEGLWTNRFDEKRVIVFKLAFFYVKLLSCNSFTVENCHCNRI